jgi:hypothetical protein
MKTVFFAPSIDGYPQPYDHPLLDEVAYIQPVPYLTYFKDRHNHHSYSKCPAWKTYYKNSYVFFSQMDIEIIYNKETGVVDNSSFEYCSFDEATGLIHELMPFGRQKGGPKNPPAYHGVAVGQINQHLMFWPKEGDEKNIWLEIQPMPNMISTHNAELIVGEFPFSRWFRPALFAFKFHNEKTIFKRGDPLGIIKFKSLNDYTEEIFLERVDPTDKIIRKFESNTRLKNFLPNKSWGLIKDAPTKVCPFTWWRNR